MSFRYYKYLALLLLFVLSSLFLSRLHALQEVARLFRNFEIQRVTLTNDGKLYAWNKEGDKLEGFPIDLSHEEKAFVFNPRIIDIDRDLSDEIVTLVQDNNSNLSLRIYKGDMTELPSWRFDLPLRVDEILSTPIIADFNADNSLDIAFSDQNGRVFILDRRFQAINFQNLNFLAPAYLLSWDHDNDGQSNLFAVSSNQIFIWNHQGVRQLFYQLPDNESVVGDLSSVFDRSSSLSYLVFSTTAERILLLNQNASPVSSIHTGQALAGPVLAEDVDLDGDTELLVVSTKKEILSYNLNGTPLGDWKKTIDYRKNTTLSSGRVADDRYPGALNSTSGTDQEIIFRSQEKKYTSLALGENVHEFDSWLPLFLLLGPQFSNVEVLPQLITPNGDGVNDTARLTYHLSDDATVSIEVLDDEGQFLYQWIQDESQSEGNHQKVWTAINNKGTATSYDDEALEKGIYTLRLSARDESGITNSFDTFGLVYGLRAKIELPEDTNKNDAIYPLVRGFVSLRGMATDPNIGEAQNNHDFHSYKLYYRPGVWQVDEAMASQAGQAGSAWLPIEVPLRHQSPTNIRNEANDSNYPNSNVSVRPVQHGLLGIWDASDSIQTPNGDYTLLLKVMDSNGNAQGTFNFDSLIVRLVNFDPQDPNFPEDLNDPRHPQNQNPRFIDLSIDPDEITQAHPRSRITYTLRNKIDMSSDVNLSINHLNDDGSLGDVVFTQNYRRQGDGDYEVFWEAVDVLGRPVDQGLYQVTLTAASIDGNGFAEDSSLQVRVSRPTRRDEDLRIESFNVAPRLLDPFNFDDNGAFPEGLLPRVAFLLNKTARVTIKIYDNPPDEGGIVVKHLLRDLLADQSPAELIWDGTNDGGQVLPTERDYYLQMEVRGVEFGRAEELILDPVLIRLQRNARNLNLQADISELRGDPELNDGVLRDDEELQALIGDPNFKWRAFGTQGYVQTPFEYTVDVFGSDNLGEQDEMTLSVTGGSRCIPQVAYVDPEFGNSIALWGCTGDNEIVVFPNGYNSVSYEITILENTDFEELGTHPYLQGDLLNLYEYHEILQSHRIHVSTNPFEVEGSFHQDVNIHEGGAPRIYAGDVDLELQRVNFLFFSIHLVGQEIYWPPYDDLGDIIGHAEDGTPIYSGGNFRAGQWPPGNGSIYGTSMRFTATAFIDTLRDQEWHHQTTFDNACAAGPFDNLDCPELYTQNYDGPIGTGLQDVNRTDVHYYTLTPRMNVNGRLINSIYRNGTYHLPGLRVWMGNNAGPLLNAQGYTSERVVARSEHGGVWETSRDTALANQSGWLEGWGLDVFHRNNFHIKSDRIFQRDYYDFDHPNRPDLYTFSNLVHLRDWNIEFVYPNGDLARAFEIHEKRVFDQGTLNIEGNNLPDVNRNYNDHFIFKLNPTEVTRRFIEIRGTAEPGFELYYYDTNLQEWITIPSATEGAVINGTLAWWDVTYLNGEELTVLLRSEVNNEINEDTIDVSIGTPLVPGERTQVSTPFGRASLDFSENTLQGDEERLITISIVDPQDESIHLQEGVVPLGPILEIKPDDLDIDPNHPVELTIRFTCEEILDLFGNDPAEVSLYNIRDSGELEVIASLLPPDPHLCDNAHPDDLFEIVGFLNHFSRYAAFNRNTTPAGILIDSPLDREFYRRNIPIEGHIDADDLAIWRISYRFIPPELDGSENLFDQFQADLLLGEPVFLAEGDGLDFDINLDSIGLDGLYEIIVEAVRDNGLISRYKREIFIDNTAPSTSFYLDGEVIFDGDRVLIQAENRIALSSIDEGDYASGVHQLFISIDGEAFRDYETELSVDDLGARGLHRIDYFSIDHIGNTEDIKTAFLSYLDPPEEGQEIQIQSQLSFSPPTFTENNTLWVNGSSEIQIQSQGDEAEIDELYYRLGSGEFREYSQAIRFANYEAGHYELEYFARDIFGRQEEIKRQTVILDNQVPQIILSTQGPAVRNLNEILISNETLIQLRAIDPGDLPSGLESLTYKIDEGDWINYNNPFRVNAAQGVFEKRLRLQATDRVSNQSDIEDYIIRFDSQSPQLEILSSTEAFSPNDDGIQDLAQFKIKVSDNFSQSISWQFFINDQMVMTQSNLALGEVFINWDGRINNVLLADGTYNYRIIAIDEQGNRSEAFEAELILDTRPPQLIIENPEEIQFGVIQQENDEENAEEPEEIQGLQIPYQVQDNIFTENLILRLEVLTFSDLQMKLIQERITSPPLDHEIIWDGTDQLDEPLNEGVYRYVVSVSDPAGNTSNVYDIEFNVDSTSPLTYYDVFGPYYQSADRLWLGEAAEVLLVARDRRSIIERFEYRLDEADNEEAWRIYRDPFSFIEEGDHLLEFKAIDSHGNISETESLNISIDLTAPETEIRFEGFQQNEGERLVLSSQTQITLESQDQGSGVFLEKFQINGMDLIFNQEPFQLAHLRSGEHTLRYWSVDHVQNREEPRDLLIRMKNDRGLTKLTIGQPRYGSDPVYITRNTALELKAFSEESNLASLNYQWDEDAIVAHRIDGLDFFRIPQFHLDIEGQHELRYWSETIEGNRERIQTKLLYSDNTAPETSIHLSQNVIDDSGVSAVTPSTSFKMNVFEEGSGIKNTYYSFGNQVQTYEAPLLIRDIMSSSGILSYYSEDHLGNREELKTKKLNLWQLKLSQVRDLRSRILFHRIDCGDNFENYNDFELMISSLQDLLPEFLTDHIDDMDKFQQALRSDIYNVIVMLPSSFDCPVMSQGPYKNIWPLLRERLYAGDILLFPEEVSQIQGRVWETLWDEIYNLNDRGESLYGQGQIDLIHLHEEDGSVDLDQVEILERRLKTYKGRDRSSNAEEVLAFSINLKNSHAPLQSSLEIEFDEFSLPIRSNFFGWNENHNKMKRSENIGALSKANYYYLLRLPKQIGAYENHLRVQSRWQNQLKDETFIDTSYQVLRDKRIIAETILSMIEDIIDEIPEEEDLWLGLYDELETKVFPEVNDFDLRHTTLIRVIDKVIGLDGNQSELRAELNEYFVLLGLSD